MCSTWSSLSRFKRTPLFFSFSFLCADSEKERSANPKEEGKRHAADSETWSPYAKWISILVTVVCTVAKIPERTTSESQMKTNPEAAALRAVGENTKANEGRGDGSCVLPHIDGLTDGLKEREGEGRCHLRPAPRECYDLVAIYLVDLTARGISRVRRLIAWLSNVP